MPARKKTATRASRAVSKTPATQDVLNAAAEARVAHPEFELRDDVIETALRTGEYRGLLEDYFGPAEYAELRELSREVAARGVRGGARVLILPGIMGSTIGRRRKLGVLDDIFWFDPLDIATGLLTRLALGRAPTTLSALGVLLIAYLKLKLRLRVAGYDADFYAFDWRLGIDELGKQLATRLKREPKTVDLVAHSMGGLVARAALAHGASCRRLIMLGTPNFGSFAPAMTLRATYPIVRKVAALDLRHTAEELAREVFSTFPGLTQMLPNPAAWNAVDLYDLDSWPADELRPREAILRGVRKVQDSLAPGASNVFLIAGVEQRTATGLRRDDRGNFVYEFSTAGDGTVPLELARLPGIGATYYIAEAHGSLPNNRLVARAVVELLARGATNELPASYTPVTRAAAAIDAVPEELLRIEPYEGRRGPLLSQRELRHMLEEVAAPDARTELPEVAAAPATVTAATVVPDAGFAHRFDRIVVGRRRQHRIDVIFAHGSITEVNSAAIALGVFRGVTPSGAASALDRRLGGAITEVARRRMFGGGVGEIFIMPTGRHAITAELVAFVGLGDFDRLSDETLQAAAENLLRTFVRARVEEFATVLFGGGSGERPESALRNLLLGFTRALVDADHEHHFRRIAICEKDTERYLALKGEMLRLSTTPICADVELTFDEATLPAEPDTPEPPRRATPGAPPVYLIIRQERTVSSTRFEVRSSVLTAGNKATVVTGAQVVTNADFEALRRRITQHDAARLPQAGLELGALLLAPEVRTVLSRLEDNHLVVVHDGALSRVPWEAMALPQQRGNGKPWFPAAQRGLSHRYAAEHLSVAKWLEERVSDNVLSVLLVADPTEDLDGAVEEGERIRTLLAPIAGVKLTEIWQSAATRPALLDAFRSGEFDVLHYAGHAQFDEAAPGRSGILCSGDEVLSGADLAGVGRLPALVFFNACESGRIRLASAPKRLAARERARHEKLRDTYLRRAVGLAEAFMRGGVANYVGTYWPVGDAAAKKFAERFYAALLAGQTIGTAVQDGRAALFPRHRDWANYVFYGNPDFVLKA